MEMKKNCTFTYTEGLDYAVLAYCEQKKDHVNKIMKTTTNTTSA